MSLRTFIRARKTIEDAGAWSDKRMPKTGGKFPLTKNRSLRVGAIGWRWRVVLLSAGANRYRLLITYHKAKGTYLAALGLECAQDTLVLGCLEYHATHVGWHMHGCCVDTDNRNSGRLRYPEMIRVPSPKQKHRNANQELTDASSLEIAARYFRIRGLRDDGPSQSEMTYERPH